MSAPHRLSQDVSSSVIASVAYSRHATPELTFRRGTRYRYVAVPATVVAERLAAPSKGASFNRHIRPRFRSERLA